MDNNRRSEIVEAKCDGAEVERESKDSLDEPRWKRAAAVELEFQSSRIE